tara:strand:+ start:504 stop:731 length:228 start_codon:yes stop_codon:yes gene_type:complete
MAFKMKAGKEGPMLKNYGPMLKGTRFIDKIKAGVKGFIAGAKESQGGFDTAQATYINEKRKYRTAQANKKTKKNN